MAGFGMLELILIAAVAVMLFPPRELPKIARSIARIYGQIRRTADDFKNQLLQDEDLNAPIREIKSAYNETRYQVRRAEEAAKRELAKARLEARLDAQKKAATDRKAAAEVATDESAPEGEAANDKTSEPMAARPVPGRVAQGDASDGLDDVDGPIRGPAVPEPTSGDEDAA